MKGYLKMSNKEINRITIMDKLKFKKITEKQAARELDLSVRQIRRIKKKYLAKGALGLIHQNRGRISNHRIADSEIDRVIEIIKNRYWDFGPTLAWEKLRQHHQAILGKETLRKIMIKANLWQFKRQRKPRLYQLRPRRACEGELVQLDGSPHLWFEARGPECTLLVFIDDATGKLFHLEFALSESTNAYFHACHGYFKTHGKPLAFYLDKHGVFRVNTTRDGMADTRDSNGLTQFGLAMKTLKIELIYANTPQAKGRVEKVNQTLQDRLTKELRLKGINTIKAANSYLPTFIQEFNQKFGVEPKSIVNVHRPLQPWEKLEEILVKKYQRILSKNLELQYQNITYQIQTERSTYALRKAPVVVAEDRFGGIKIYYKNQELKYQIISKQPKSEIVDSKRLNLKMEEVKLNQQQMAIITNKQETNRRWKPAPNHPWRQYAYTNTNY